MGILKHAPTASKYKELLKRKIQDLVLWFHKEYMNCVFDPPMPPKIGNAEICLFDLFELVDGVGGSKQVSKEDQWDIVGMSIDFPPWLKYKFQGIFGNYFELLDSFYRTLMDERTAMESRNDNAETLIVDHIGHDNRVDGINITTPGNGSEEEENQTQQTNEGTDVQEELLDYNNANIVYDDGERLLITLEEGNDSEEEDPSIVEYYNRDEAESDSPDSK